MRSEMTVTIDLPPEVAEALQQHAARTGQDLSAVILQAVQEKMARARTFDEICAPFARAVEATGMTDEEFDRFFEEIREEVWQDKQGKAG
jgi:predicted transcriptional regulator